MSMFIYSRQFCIRWTFFCTLVLLFRTRTRSSAQTCTATRAVPKWKSNSILNKSNFETKIVPPNKIKNKKSGRTSGGIMIVYRKYLKPKLEFIEICKNYIGG